LPTVATEGDVLADLLVVAGAGVAVAPRMKQSSKRRCSACSRRLPASGDGPWAPTRHTGTSGRSCSGRSCFCADPVRSPDLLASSTRHAIGRQRSHALAHPRTPTASSSWCGGAGGTSRTYTARSRRKRTPEVG
jgi:hypothetical protein